MSVTETALMSDFINFSGLRHISIGNARLYQQHNSLLVSDCSRPTDGVAIETGFAKGVTIEFHPFTLRNSKVLAITFYAIDGKQCLMEIGQWVIIRKLTEGTVYLMLNMKAEKNNSLIAGRLGETDMFFNSIGKQTADTWVTVGTFDLGDMDAHLYSVDCRMEMLRDDKGKVVKVITTKSIGSKGLFRPLSDNNKLDECAYDIDTLRIISETDYPKGLPYHQEYHISKVVITGKDVPCMVLKQSVVQ